MEEFVNRRDFLRTFSVIAATSMVAGSMPWLQGIAQEPAGRTVRLGIIGMGSRGKYLHLMLEDIPDLDICCVCDNYEPNLSEGLQILGPRARGYKDYREMLEKEQLDAVVIATPLHVHAHQTIDALNAGIHVMCEKSLALTYEDCNDMVRAHQNTGKILYVGHQRMFNIRFIQAYKMIREGRIGNVTQIRAYWHRNTVWKRPVPSPELERHINWRFYHEYSAGIMTELASHQIQVANQIYDEHPECVWGAGSINHWKDGRETDDNANLVFKYPGGSHLVYDALMSNMHHGIEEQILGPLGTMELEAGKMWEEFPPPAPGILSLINHLERKFFDAVPIGGASWIPDSAVSRKGDWIIDKVLDNDGSKMLMEAFIADVRSNRVDSFITKQGFYASIAALMGHHAIQNNEIVHWPGGLAM